MLRKGLMLLLTLVFVSLFQIAPALAAGDTSSTASSGNYSYFKNIELVIGEKEASVNSTPVTLDQAAFVSKGRTLVPLRFISESLGAQVDWNGKTKQATIKLGGSTLVVTIGSKAAYVDKELTTLDVPALMVGGRTFVPIRFVSESFGAVVDYDAEAEMVTVRYADQTGWKKYEATKLGGYFMYPADWTVETTTSGFEIDFTSPKGSILKIYTSAQKPSTLYKMYKTAFQDDGWIFDAEYFATKGKIDEGFNLDYKKTDPTTKQTIWDYFYVDPLETGSYIVDQTISEENIDVDSVVMGAIAF
jgi:hypothetical protein